MFEQLNHHMSKNRHSQYWIFNHMSQNLWFSTCKVISCDNSFTNCKISYAKFFSRSRSLTITPLLYMLIPLIIQQAMEESNAITAVQLPLEDSDNVISLYVVNEMSHNRNHVTIRHVCGYLTILRLTSNQSMYFRIFTKISRKATWTNTTRDP